MQLNVTLKFNLSQWNVSENRSCGHLQFKGQARFPGFSFPFPWFICNPAMTTQMKTIPAGKLVPKDGKSLTLWMSLWSKATHHPELPTWDCYTGEKYNSVISATVIWGHCYSRAIALIIHHNTWKWLDGYSPKLEVLPAIRIQDGLHLTWVLGRAQDNFRCWWGLAVIIQNNRNEGIWEACNQEREHYLS